MVGGLNLKAFGSLLGLARRAGAVAVGARAAREAVLRGEARAVFVARDAGSSAHRALRASCETMGVPCVEVVDKVTLGACLGRNALAAVAVTEPGLAERLCSYLRGGTERG